MNFKFTEQEKAIQEEIREFTEKEVLPGVIERDENGEFPKEIFKEIAKKGYLGIQYPKEAHGKDAGYIAYAIVIEELSKVDASLGATYSIAATLFGNGIVLHGTQEQKDKYLKPVFQGDKRACFALTEPNAGSDSSNMTTTAIRDGDEYILNGLKCFITNAPVSDYALVFAKTDPEDPGVRGISAFIIEMDWPGVSIGHIENKMGLRSAQVSEVIFEDVRVPAANILGEEGQGFRFAMEILDCGRVGVAAQGLGIAKGAFEIARKYMMEREQFGQPIYRNQHLAFRMAELKTEIDKAELILYRAAQVQNDGEPLTIPAAMAKLVCTDVAMLVTTEAVQMLGGNGYMREYHVERMMRDAKITQIYEGTNQIQKLLIANSLFRK